MARRKAGSERGKKPPPRCKAILLCEHVRQESATGNVSILGVFDRFRVNTFPETAKAFTVFLQLVEGIGRCRLTMEIHDLREDEILARMTTPGIKFQKRLGKLNVAIPVSGLALPHAGYFDLVVFVDGQEVDRQKFSASSPEDQAHGEAETIGPSES
jgi:hypothetical protein